MTPQSRARRFMRLLAATVLLPLAILLLGCWEQQRGIADWLDLHNEQLRLSGVVAQLEAQAPKNGKMDFTMQFRRNGQLYGGPLALDQAREALKEVASLTKVMDLRRILPPVVMGASAFVAALSLLVLITGGALGWLGRTSREILVRGFSLVRTVLPAILATQVVLGTTAFVSVVVFEAAALAQPGIGTGEIKLLAGACIAVLGSIFVAGSTLAGLRHALAAFEPDPLPILGRLVPPAAAPGLWRLVDGLAERLGSLKPDTIVVGLTEGFFVSAGPKILQPGGHKLAGRTLYVPLPYLTLLRGDEVASIIGHELAHFAGGDTAYSLRFLPIYAGVGRSLDAVAAVGEGSGSAFGLLSPAMWLGLFVMDRFHYAVRHWSRTREFAADRVGAGPTSPEAAARALLRVGAVRPRIVETLDEAAENRGMGAPDMVAAVLDHAIARGLDDPAAHLEAEQTHPTDTHPTTRDRLAALGCPPSPERLDAARAAPPREALGKLAAYFDDPVGLCQAATADFLAAVRQNDDALQAHLAATAAKVDADDRVLTVNKRPQGYVLLVSGGVMIGVSLILLVTDVPGLGAGELRLVAATSATLGALLAGFGLFCLWQGERTSLVFGRDALTVPGLDRPIAWDDIADLDLACDYNRMTTRLLLRPGSPLPERVTRARNVKLDPKQRIVTLKTILPGKMKPQEFADLLGRYQHAAEARRRLAALNAAPHVLAGDALMV
ncbi:M48 family metallopeptidase [Lichenihabitans psoromatis]|uniref:M48 family metallopeptidase n=1 Tax=Lichenihabitans psoromatis TaxID=2528642 RepID=UPI001FE1D3C7|nr:M48 family metallopeptidase [Lichenihabitans psoromatis]